MKKNKLPTNRDVMQYLMFLRHEGTTRVPKHCRYLDYSSYVVREICELWQRTNIPIVGKTAIGRYIAKLLKRRFDNRKYDEEEWNELFRISRCKCGIELNIKCSCPAALKIPQNFEEFFIDQCGPRLLSLQPEQTDAVESAEENEDPLMI